MCYSLWYDAPTMLPAGGRQHRVVLHYTTSCNTQSSVPEDGQNNFPKHVELTGIINKPLLLHLVGCLYYLYQRCTVKQISDNEIYLLIKYIKSVLWKVAECLSYRQDARCLKVKPTCMPVPSVLCKQGSTLVLKCTYVVVTRSSSFIKLWSVITIQEKTKRVTDRGSIPE